MLQRVFVVVVATVSTRPFLSGGSRPSSSKLSLSLSVVDAPVVKRRDFAEGIGW